MLKLKLNFSQAANGRSSHWRPWLLTQGVCLGKAKARAARRSPCLGLGRVPELQQISILDVSLRLTMNLQHLLNFLELQCSFVYKMRM